MSNVIWSPQPKQAIFMSRPEYEVMYGGAAGGGKSDALLAEGLRQVHVPNYRGLIIRKTYPQLSELVDRSHSIYKPSFPGARYNDTKHCWTFPSGAKLYFGAMQHTKDRINYQGKRYDFIAFDELTHFTYDEYSYMFSRNRPDGPGTIVYMRSTTNPGGVGHGWVKARFIDPAPPFTPMYDTVKYVDADGNVKTQRKSRMFIPATIHDNRRLMENDPAYIASLAMLPEQERAALLEGSWDVFSGQVFTEWRNEPNGYRSRKLTHVIEPFDFPRHWRIYRGFDWGYSKPFSVGWFAVDEEGRIYLFRELYGTEGRPDTGCKWDVGKLAQEIRRIEQEDDRIKGQRVTGIADPAIFAKNGGQSQADIMESYGVFFNRGDNNRLAGKMQFHYRLRFNEIDIPMFYVFNTCSHFIRTFPNLVYDLRDVEDIDSSGEDHAYDMARYVLMENPITAPLPAEPKPYRDDPLDLGLNRVI